MQKYQPVIFAPFFVHPVTAACSAAKGESEHLKRIGKEDLKKGEDFIRRSKSARRTGKKIIGFFCV